jgi:2-oxoglutarate ferredoxin oxidoreductase subunit beta
MELGATFVGQSFSGDKDQLIPLIKAAMSHQGFAFLNVISPCVTFNNNVGSTKSYDYVREHVEATSTFDFVPIAKAINTSYEEGTTQDLTMHDGTVIRLNKVSEDWNPLDRFSAINAMQKAKSEGEILTGLLYMNGDHKDLHQLLETSNTPLNQLTEKDLCPGLEVLEGINDSFR